MQVETDEPDVIERVAALDVGKAEVLYCARVPGPRDEKPKPAGTGSRRRRRPPPGRRTPSGR
jgi:transposase